MPSPPPALIPAEGISRRNYGRNHSYKIDGLKVPGVTTITGHFKSGALVEYPGKQVANYAVDNWGTPPAPGHPADPDDPGSPGSGLSALPPAARLKELLASRWADRDAAAGRGSLVHAIARRLHEGETEVPYPEELAGHVEACVDFLDRLEPKIVAAELILGNRTVRYCGTLDLIADLGPIPWDGTIIPPARWLLDLKTGRSGIWPETAMQLAGYEHAEVFLGEDGAERPMEWLEIERCAAVWIRGDGWDLIPVDTGPDTWAYFQYLAWLYHQEEARKEWVGVAAGPWPTQGGN
jgi:hypothetical protein